MDAADRDICGLFEIGDDWPECVAVTRSRLSLVSSAPVRWATERLSCKMPRRDHRLNRL
jgi:hypothetical protein